uniref:3'-5' exonuclease n=1 Tax=uncultured Clostridium sp. TaxID=59620 RepID=UPI0025930C25
ICGDNGGASKHINGEGVIITTIDSALGLDFNTVILTGLYPLQYVIKDKSFYKVKSWTELKEKEESDKEIYISNLRKIYTACSRARENLYILSDLDSNTPINDFIKMGM